MSEALQIPRTCDRIDWKAPDYVPVLVERAERLKRIRANPGAIAAYKAFYREHPWQFIDDWGMTSDPRNARKGVPVTVPFILWPRQLEWLKWAYEMWRTGQSSISEKSRDCGLSWCAMSFFCTMALFNDHLAFGVGSRKKELVDEAGDPKCLFYKAREFLRYLPVEFRGGWDPKLHSKHMLLTFPETGSTIAGELGDNIGRGGRTSAYLVDEAAHLEHSELIDAALGDNTDVRFDISSVNGMANTFATRRHSGHWPVFEFDWRSDPRKDEAWLAKRREMYGDAIVRQEILRDYHAGTGHVLIPGEWIELAIDSHKKLGITVKGERRGALDVADTGMDKNCLALRHGILLSFLESWSGTGSDIYETSARAMRLCDEHSCRDWDFDGDGLGAGVRGDVKKINEARAGAIRDAHPQLKGRFPVPHTVGQFRGSASPLFPTQLVRGPTGEPLDRTNEDMFKNLKAQAWWALRYRFEQTARAVKGQSYDPSQLISIDSTLPELASLKVELAQPTYKLDGAGRMLIDKAPDGVASPNRADSVMMVFAPRISPMRIAPGLIE